MFTRWRHLVGSLLIAGTITGVVWIQRRTSRDTVATAHFKDSGIRTTDLDRESRVEVETTQSLIDRAFQDLPHPDRSFSPTSPLSTLLVEARNGEERRRQVHDRSVALAQHTSVSIYTRVQAVALLAELHNEASLSTLTRLLLSDPNTLVRTAAALAIGEYPDIASSHTLASALSSEQDEFVQHAIRQASAGKYRGKFTELLTTNALTAFLAAKTEAIATTKFIPNQEQLPVDAGAVRALEKFLEADWNILSPYSVSAMNRLAVRAYSRSGRFEDAKACLARAIEIVAPDRYANVLEMSLAGVEYRSGDLTAAAHRVRRLMKRPLPKTYDDPNEYAPQLFTAPQLLAKIYRDGGDEDACRALMKQMAETAERLTHEHSAQAQQFASYAFTAYNYQLSQLRPYHWTNKAAKEAILQEFKKRFPAANPDQVKELRRNAGLMN